MGPHVHLQDLGTAFSGLSLIPDGQPIIAKRYLSAIGAGSTARPEWSRLLLLTYMPNSRLIHNLQARLKLLGRVIQNLEHLATLRQDPSQREIARKLRAAARDVDACAARLLPAGARGEKLSAKGARARPRAKQVRTRGVVAARDMGRNRRASGEVPPPMQ